MSVAVDVFRSVTPDGWDYERFRTFVDRSAALGRMPLKSIAAREFRAATWFGLMEDFQPESETDLEVLTEVAEIRQAELVAERDALAVDREARTAAGTWRASDGRRVDRLDRDIAELLELRTLAVAAGV